MFFDRRDEQKEVHKGAVLVGYDLGKEYSQISYCVYGEEEVESVPTVAGTKQYNIPTVLFKRKNVNQWLYGKDALKAHADREEGTLIRNLLDLVREGEPLILDGQEYTPRALLTLFLKRTLMLLGFLTTIERIGAVMFTAEDLEENLIDALSQAAANLSLPTSRIYVQSHTESFYFFMLHQPAELWNYQVLACEHDGKQLRTYRMECNKKTKPIVTLIAEETYDRLPLPAENEPDEAKEDALHFVDERLLGILQKECEGRIISSAYLLGEGFRDNWAKESLRFLCRNRRVFQGNNLFCKGACFGLMERLSPSEAGETHIYLGPDKLKANVGMQVYKQGKESYYALLDAGENWFDVRKQCDFLLPGDEHEIELRITPLTGGPARVQTISLDTEENVGAGERAAFCRYRMEMFMMSPVCVAMTIRDLGFGDMASGSGRVWERQFLTEDET